MLATLPFTQTKNNRDTSERIDGLEYDLHWLVNRLSGDDTWCLEFNSLSYAGLDGSMIINGVTENVNDSAKYALTNVDFDDGAGSLGNITLWDLSILITKVILNCHTTNMVLLFF